MNLNQLGIHEIRARFRAGTLTSLALAQALIERTNAQQALKGYAAFDADTLLRQAAAADARMAAGEDLPLLGVPIALKDNIDSTDYPSAAGTSGLQGSVPAADAEVVRRLRAAGALVAGKASMHELAFGVTTDNATTGTARNPWDTDRMPGGSSGGCGVVVAAGLVPAAIGTDTGGSVRVPSALCGLVGLRPTAGRVPGRGIAPISTTRDTPGPMARCIQDCALLDAVLAPGPSPLFTVSLAGVRLGVPAHHFWDDLDPGVRAVSEAALDRLRAAGGTLVPVDLSGVAALNASTGFPIALHEFVRDMRDYLAYAGRGIGFDALVAGVKSPDVRAIVTPLLGDGAISGAAYDQAMACRQQLQNLYAQAFLSAGVHALVFPTTPALAAPAGENTEVVVNGQPQPVFPTFIRNTDPGSNAGLPGLTLPIGLSAGLPVGLALDGMPGSDRLLLSLGSAIEKLFPTNTAPWMR